MPQALYDTIGRGYARHRRADPRLAARIHAALDGARSVVNVGAGAGSYEPAGSRLVAVEPSAVMVRQRAAGSAPAVRGSADALPFRDGAFDAAMALLTMHHWPDWRQGLVEMRRVARRVVLFTWDPDAPAFWLVRDYVPAVLEVDRPVFPTFGEIARVLGPVDVRPVPIPSDCTDGFLAAYWRRPEAYLDADVRGAISVFARIPDLDGPLARLAADLADGTWAERWGWLLQQTEFDAGYRLVTAGDPPAWPSGESTMPS